MQLTLGEITNPWLARARDRAALWCYAHLHCAHIQLVSVQISCEFFFFFSLHCSRGPPANRSKPAGKEVQRSSEWACVSQRVRESKSWVTLLLVGLSWTGW